MSRRQSFVTEGGKTSKMAMAELSQEELKVIRAHPVRKGLETFRTTFNSRYLKKERANLTEVIDQLTSEEPDRGEDDYSRASQGC